VAEGLGIIQGNYPMLAIGSYPQYQNGRFGTALVLRGIDDEALAKATQEVVDLVKSIGDENPIVA
jgi:hypothetical protein